MKRAWIAREICANQRNLWLEPLVRQFIEFVVFPPWFGNVTVCQDSSTASYQKACPENIKLHLWPVPFQREDRIPLAVLQRLALRIQSGIPQPLSALFLIKRDRHVKQAYALNVYWNQVLSG